MISKKVEVPKTISKTESLFFDELKKFKGENVTITLTNGRPIHAKVLAIEFNHLSFIVEYPDGIKEMIRGESIQSVRMGIKIEKEL